MKDLHEKGCYDTSTLNFLKESSSLICEFRRNLKWTYCFGYFIENQQNRDLFEFHQAYFEKSCENLHSLLVKELTPFYENKVEFDLYKQKVVNLTQSTKKVFFLRFNYFSLWKKSSKKSRKEE